MSRHVIPGSRTRRTEGTQSNAGREDTHKRNKWRSLHMKGESANPRSSWKWPIKWCVPYLLSAILNGSYDCMAR